MAADSYRILNVDAAVSVPGLEGTCPANSFSVAWGINIIPYANLVLPLNYSSKETFEAYKSDDPSRSAEMKTFDILNDLKEGDDSSNSVSVTITVEEVISGGFSAPLASMTLDGWKITNVTLQPQNKTSPGGVILQIEHPMCRLRSTPGFFYVSGLDFEKFANDIDGGGIIEIGDSVTEKLKEMIDDRGSREGGVRWNIESAADVYNVKLSEYIDDSLGLPYVGSEGINWGNADMSALEKACKVMLAYQFFDLRNSVPLDAVLVLARMLGFYIRINYDDKRASLEKLDPWAGRESVTAIPDEIIESVKISPDTSPICGIRLTSTNADTTIVSTLGSFRPLDASANASSDTMFYYSSKGAIINTTTPDFLGKMLGLAAKLVSNPASSGKTSTHSEDENIVPRDHVEDPADTINVVGNSKSASITILDDVHNVTAEALFCQQYKARQIVSASCALVTDSFPGIGTFASVSVGTGGKDITGMVTGIVVEGSSSGGTCRFTVNMAYCGDPPDIGGKMPENKVF